MKAFSGYVLVFEEQGFGEEFTISATSKSDARKRLRELYNYPVSVKFNNKIKVRA